jgi:hypothetical protein
MSENHTFVLQQVIDDLLNGDNSLEIALLKLNYFARLVKNEELLQFTNLEINGYKGDIDPPAYRKAIGTLTVNLQAWQNYYTKEVPVSMLEEPFNEKLQFLGIYDGIKVLESMAAKANNSDSQLLKTDLPMEMLSYIQPAVTKLYKSNVKLVAIGAMLTANPNVVIQIISTVRSRLLAFVMEIAEKFGYTIEISSFKTDLTVNNQVINNFIRTEITNTGNENIINTGSGIEITKS